MSFKCGFIAWIHQLLEIPQILGQLLRSSFKYLFLDAKARRRWSLVAFPQKFSSNSSFLQIANFCSIAHHGKRGNCCRAQGFCRWATPWRIQPGYRIKRCWNSTMLPTPTQIPALDDRSQRGRGSRRSGHLVWADPAWVAIHETEFSIDTERRAAAAAFHVHLAS